MMGTNEKHAYEIGMDNYTERPAHKVCVDDFYLDKYETSQKEWNQVMGERLFHFTGNELPVDNLKFNDAVKYCQKQGKRLPYEAEWEYAARGGSAHKGRTPWGDATNGEYVWFAGNSNRQPPSIGTKKPNPLGVHDMMGGVWEWVSDWYSIDYYAHSPVNNPKGPEEQQSWHVIRGLSWVDQQSEFRVTVRFNGDSDRTLHFFVGVRCAQSAASPVPSGELKKGSSAGAHPR